MPPPIQRLAWCQTQNLEERGVLLVASGPHLITVSLRDGTTLSHWSSASPSASSEEPAEPPAKRHKGSPNTKGSQAPNIALLRLASSRRHAVAVTAEDKSVHVFGLGPDGRLEHLSRRCMPKRPSAVSLTPDDAHVLVADKFGDVYALPLLPDAADEAAFLAAAQARDRQRAYKPAATALTVHSQRNLKALEQQLKQQQHHHQQDGPAKTKEPLRFSHQLLLGHVSVLTDVLSVRTAHGEKHRDYIITADRDEHVRVSRGLPQAHVIEGFCLGHRSFVSRLCMVAGLLVSGDGDGHLRVWDWRGGKLLRGFDVGKCVADGGGGGERSHGRLPISGLWAYPNDAEAELLLIACEGHDTLWYVRAEDLLGHDTGGVRRGHDLDGNILDLAICGDRIVVSRDTRHAARSMDEPRGLPADGTTSDISPLCMLTYDEKAGGFTEVPADAHGAAQGVVRRLQDAIGTDADGPWPGELVYGLHNLRKRSGEDNGDEPT